MAAKKPVEKKPAKKRTVNAALLKPACSVAGACGDCRPEVAGAFRGEQEDLGLHQEVWSAGQEEQAPDQP